MGALVDDMLLLAKFDQGRPLERAAVDVSALAADAALDARALDTRRVVRCLGEAGVVVCGDVLRLRQVLANLVANALVHTPAGSPIEIDVRRIGGAVRLAVIDHGPGIAPEFAAQAFARFTRDDASRTRHNGGSGLGLAIVDSIVHAHHGTTTIEPTPAGGATIVVSVPASEAAAVVATPPTLVTTTRHI